MALSPRLDLRQTQNLVVTPQLQQAIKLLQLSSAELALYLDRELEANPLLEMDDSHEPPVLSEALGGEPEAGASAPEVTAPLARDGETPFDFAGEDGGGDEDGVGPDTGEGAPAGDGGSLGDSWSGVRGSSDFEGSAVDRAAAAGPDLRSHLMQQLNLAFSGQSDRLIGSFLIEQLDESGYLAISIEDAARQLGCTEADVTRVLGVLQTFDPAGIFARDLKECLKLQLIDRDRFDPAMEAFVTNLDLLGVGDVKRLREVCQVSQEDIQDMIAEIRGLDPKPALRFERRTDETVVPDVVMTGRPGGVWRVELNPDTLPRVLVNQSYVTEISRVVSTEREKEFVAERLQAANWLVRALQQRAETILKVSAEIIRQQEGFFRHGVSHLKPLVLRDIAEKIEMHESTVSRVTANKFMATPRGTFELKYFFSNTIAAEAGAGRADGGTTPEAVRHRIKALIDAEAPDDVLSDDGLVDLLRAEGIDVARRTVAKYRESLNIPSSVQRRRAHAVKLAGRPAPT
ncbi:MAG: RNA polymerase factor sigma-54 [Rhodospirillaceae bacterium]|nr:RNA polymerase factor sigma-54 [Rhodospirillaceae bacterium]